MYRTKNRSKEILFLNLIQKQLSWTILNRREMFSFVKILVILFSIYTTSPLIASEEAIRAVIADAETREPLPYASVMVKGRQKGTVSNSEGHFVLSLEGVQPQDTLLFSYMGYETLRVLPGSLSGKDTVFLRPATLALNEVQVFTTRLSAEEILKQVREHYKENHGAATQRQRIFFHNYEKVPFGKENKIVLKESDFAGLDKATFEDLFRKLPEEFINYQDALVELYSYQDQHKLVPVQGISLEEGGLQTLMQEVENRLGRFFDDIEKGMADEDIYYKVRTGIIGQKIGYKKSITAEEDDDDSLHYTLETKIIKEDLLSLFRRYSQMDSKEWTFIHQPAHYRYVLEDLTVFNGEAVYRISFTPRQKGLYEGTLYIARDSYALVQLDFAYAEGKQSEKFKLLGLGHAIRNRQAHVLFEKDDKGSFVKYMYVRQKEWIKVDRNFSVVKKQRRFLIDKELSEMKLEAEISLETETACEVLVLEREVIAPSGFERTTQPETMLFRREYAHSPQMWENRTIITPAAELRKYKRK